MKNTWETQHVDVGLATLLKVTDEKRLENSYGMLMLVLLPSHRYTT